jgi:hypothetical protein
MAIRGSAIAVGIAMLIAVVFIGMMYVRRVFVDLQGQIDDIETVLAAMPPELTSGQPLAYPPPLAAAPQQYSQEDDGMQEGGGVGVGGEFVPDEELEGEDAGEDYRGSEAEEPIQTYDAMPEYSIDDIGVATLSEPGIYEAGVVQLTVLPAGNEHAIEVEELGGGDESVTEEESGGEGGDEGDGDEAGDAEMALSPEPVEEREDSPVAGDEFDMLTLPELKARLKGVQPDTRGIARMKRAEVLDRLRSMPTEETNE